jgi:hypothetical protein
VPPRKRNLRGLGRSCGFRCRPNAGPVTARPACATHASRDEPQEVGRTQSTPSAGEPRAWGRGPQNMSLARETRSLRSEGRHAGPRASKEAHRGSSTGQDNSARRMPSCEPCSEERRAGNPHATICGGGRWVTTPSTRRRRVTSIPTATSNPLQGRDLHAFYFGASRCSNPLMWNTWAYRCPFSTHHRQPVSRSNLLHLRVTVGDYIKL